MNETRARGHTRAAMEILATIATSGLHLLFENIWHRKGLFLAVAAVPWGVYLARQCVGARSGAIRWGLSGSPFLPAMRAVTTAGLPVLALLLLGSAALGRIPFPPSFWIVLPLYPLWGLVQQLLLNGLLASNLRRFVSPAATVAAASLLFAAAHWPDLPLMGLTFLLALGFVPLYLRHRNLYALALWHGILGTVAFYGILGRDAGTWFMQSLF